MLGFVSLTTNLLADRIFLLRSLALEAVSCANFYAEEQNVIKERGSDRAG